MAWLTLALASKRMLAGSSALAANCSERTTYAEHAKRIVVRGERWFGEAITLLHCDRRTGIELRYFAFP